MTYTTVYKDYPADTFAAAAAEMLLDSEIWARTGWGEAEMADVGTVLALAGGEAKGGHMAYAVDHWDWTGHVLRVWFR